MGIFETNQKPLNARRFDGYFRIGTISSRNYTFLLWRPKKVGAARARPGIDDQEMGSSFLKLILAQTFSFWERDGDQFIFQTNFGDGGKFLIFATLDEPNYYDGCRGGVRLFFQSSSKFLKKFTDISLVPSLDQSSLHFRRNAPTFSKFSKAMQHSS